KAPAALTRAVITRRLIGVMRPPVTRAARTTQQPITASSLTSRNERRSRMSVRAPAGNARRKSGALVATCTSETLNGSGLRAEITRPEAAAEIQPPRFETSVATQITANVGCWKALSGPASEDPEVPALT